VSSISSPLATASKYFLVGSETIFNKDATALIEASEVIN
jgi:hypothetical protein